jgi:single-strand DNA-binding protein
MNLNKVIIAGRITKDPEKRASNSGVSITTFSVATNHKTKDKEQVEFHNVVAFSGTADAIANYMKKGNEILVEGRLQTSSWEKDGVKKYKTEIIAEKVEFGSRPKKVEEDINTSDIPL